MIEMKKGKEKKEKKYSLVEELKELVGANVKWMSDILNSHDSKGDSSLATALGIGAFSQDKIKQDILSEILELKQLIEWGEAGGADMYFLKSELRRLIQEAAILTRPDLLGLFENLYKYIVEVKKKEIGVKLEEAEVVVVAGRGVKKKEDLAMLEELAKLLGGVVGCTRPLAADLKWFPIWVGMSGVTIKPKLYIGVGVSGQVQHVAGIRDSKVIVAINIDPNAPIFEHVDYGIVGDLYKVVPKLIEELKKVKK